MFKKYFDKYIETWIDATFDVLFNHILTLTSLLAVCTTAAHYMFPMHSAEIDSANVAILAAMRKGM
jgi:hypothetical protein